MSATYYVDAQNGNDSASGSSLSQAWRTIDKANTQMQPGDITYISAGTYNETVRPARSGTASNYITYASMGNGDVAISGVTYGANLTDRSYIAVDGLKILDTGDAWVMIENGSYNTVANCHMEGNRSWAGVSIKNNANYNQIISNVCISTCSGTTGGPADTVEILNDSHHNLIEGNTINYANHVAIGVRYGCDYTIIRNNTVYNPWHSCVSAVDCDYILMENNSVLDSGDICEYDSCPGNACGSERDRTAMKRYNHNGTRFNTRYGVIRNNVVINCGEGISFGSYEYKGNDIVSFRNRVYNNTWNKNWRTIYVSRTTALPTTETIIKNNISFNSREYELLVYIDNGSAARDNYYINNVLSGSMLKFQGAHYSTLGSLESAYPQYFIDNIAIDPLFDDEDGRNLSLLASSPVIDAGAWLTQTSSAGSGTIMQVNDAHYFVDGWGLISGDVIQLEGQTQTARITSVDYNNNRLTLDRALSWSANQGVALAYIGNAPDIGAFEYSNGSSQQSPTADAGPDQGLTDSDNNGSESVTLDGSGSSDADGTIAQYAWVENGSQVASGQSPTVALSVGQHTITLTVTDDAGATDSDTVVVTVNVPVNSAPVLSAIGNKSVTENALLTFNLSASDADGDALTYSAQNLPSGASLSGATFAWTPEYSQAGSHDVTFVASDGQGQDSETVTITVGNTNRAPVLAAIGSQSITVGDTLGFSLSATDADGDNLSYSAPNLPAGAQLTGQGFSWTPSAGQAGSYTVTFRVSDGTDQDSEAVQVTVVDVDQTAPAVSGLAPAAGDIQVPPNTLVDLHVTDSGDGVDGNSVTIRVNNDLVYSGNQADAATAYGNCRRTGTEADFRYSYQPGQTFDFDQSVSITVNATDRANNAMAPYSYSFTTEMHTFGRNIAISSEQNPANQGYPAVITDSQGYIWATWHSGNVGARNVYVGGRNPTTGQFDQSIQLTSHGGDQCYPDIAVAPDDRIYVVWQDNRNTKWDVYGASSTDGTTWSSNQKLSDSNYNQTAPALVVGQQSPYVVHLAYEDDRNGGQGFRLVSSASVLPNGTGFQLVSGVWNPSDIALAIGQDDTLYAVWTDGRNGNADIYGAASNDGPWTQRALVTGNASQHSPALAVQSGSSVLHLLWVEDVGSDLDIFYGSSVGIPTSPLSGVSIIDDTSGGDQIEPTLVTTNLLTQTRVYACWTDYRIVGGNQDSDLYYTNLGSGSARTNVLVGDDGTNANQTEPDLTVDAYGQPFVVWTDDRGVSTQVYSAGTSFVSPIPMDEATLVASQGGVVGVAPQAIDSIDDVSVVVPAGALQSDVTISISEIQNPPAFASEHISAYDFGPSGIQFNEPVTITIPFMVTDTASQARIFWYNALTDALSEQGITDVQTIVVSPTLRALTFKTTHFTPFYLLLGAPDSGSSGGGSGGSGGCAMSPTAQGNVLEFVIPYVALALVWVGSNNMRARQRRREERSLT